MTVLNTSPAAILIEFHCRICKERNLTDAPPERIMVEDSMPDEEASLCEVGKYPICTQCRTQFPNVDRLIKVLNDVVEDVE